MSRHKLSEYFSVILDEHRPAMALADALSASMLDRWLDRKGSKSWEYSLFVKDAMIEGSRLESGIGFDKITNLFACFCDKVSETFAVNRTHYFVNRPGSDVVLCELADDAGLLFLQTHDVVGSFVTQFRISGIEPADHVNSVASVVLQAAEDCGLTLDTPALNNKIPVVYAFPDRGHVRVVDRYFDPRNLDSIECNYVPEVVDKMKETLQLLRESSNGLVVLNGPAGTGKTHLLRALLSETNGRQGMVCSPPLQFLTDIGLLAQAISLHDSNLVVFEDLGDVLTKQSSTEHVEVYSNLLNITDGLLSLLSNTVVVLTFNTNIGDINEAVLRPGRCLSHIEVNELPVDHVRGLLAEVGLGNMELSKSKYTLAEVYEMKRTGRANRKNNHRREPAGFVR